MEKTQSVTILGATGSVGRQSLDVARNLSLRVDCVSASTNVATTEAICREFHPRHAVMADEGAARELALRLADTDTQVSGGSDAICDAVREVGSDVVVNAILGEAGLEPTLAAIESSPRLALSNKESLVVAGEIVNAALAKSGCTMIPVDSEHSAIFQALHAGRKSEISRIFLTASGGPFRGYTSEMLDAVSLDDTLAHPTWQMGAKITVDSATLANKGFEVIEAVHLFGVSADQIKVVVHPESIIHSAIEYIDSATIAQMSMPDMRLCVQYAITYPERKPGLTPPLDLAKLAKLTFSEPDGETFPLLPLAFRVIREGGAMPATFNAANEIAVSAFLHQKISFKRISEVVLETVERLSISKESHTLEEIIAFDHEARGVAKTIL